MGAIGVIFQSGAAGRARRPRLFAAVECLSSQPAIIPVSELDLETKKCERFCQFILRYGVAAGRAGPAHNPPQVRALLKQIFYVHRSAFVHGGKEVPHAALVADSVGAPYFKHIVAGKEVKTPGLDWFAGIVRVAILGYIRSIQAGQADATLLAGLALETAVLQFKAKKDRLGARFRSPRRRLRHWTIEAYVVEFTGTRGAPGPGVGG